jgi:NAD+ synthase (glutamine-hydrolysing)
MMAQTPSSLRVALAQLNYKVGDLDANVAKIREAVASARAGGAELVVFSELALTGYPPQDLVHRKGFIDAQLRHLEALSALTDDDFGIVVGFIDRNPGKGKHLFNAAALLHEGKVKARVHKTLLPTYDVFTEARYFEPNDVFEPVSFKGVALGITICEDSWTIPSGWEMPAYSVDPLAELANKGADLLINLSASPFGMTKASFRKGLLGGHARALGKPLVFVNQIGGNDELVFDGCSYAFNQDGELVARLKSFEEDLLVTEIYYTKMFIGEPSWMRPAPATAEEEARQALVLGLRDYVHKTGFNKVTIGLSGGVDSALVAALATQALGPENVLCVGMPSRYSSEHSVDDARRLCENLGVRFEVSSIEPQFQAFLDQLEPLFEGRGPDVTEENIQARIRGVNLMALSNKFGGLVLACGNKSEIAVGYCTLYGDMCGALSVIGDVPKMLVYGICRHINDEAGKEVIPESILTKAPSAELRPDQRDEDSLPPYPVLDAILEAYVVECDGPEAIIARGFDEATVRRVIRLVHINEYKRKQAAPVLKISSKAFGPGWQYALAASYDVL